MNDSQRLFITNLSPKPISDMAAWLDTQEGRDWFMNPIMGWDAGGHPIRRPLDASCITAGTISTTAIRNHRLGGFRGSKYDDSPCPKCGRCGIWRIMECWCGPTVDWPH
jgi:hypothetical protein